MQGHVAPVAWLQLGFLGTARAGAVKAEGAGARCDIGEVRDGGFAELSRRRGERRKAEQQRMRRKKGE